MNVREVAEWLLSLEDQTATVCVIHHTTGRGYYNQGGDAKEVQFNPDKHVEHWDFHTGNTLTLGLLND